MAIFFSQYAQSLFFLCKTEIHSETFIENVKIKYIYIFDFQEVVNVIKNSNMSKIASEERR